MKYTLEKKDGIEYYSIPNLRKVQLAQLELLKIVDKVAQDNGIDYWIDGGTLLGAVRHGGFIPWDDDLDICLLKKDYDKLIPLLYSHIKNSEKYALMYYNSNVLYWAERLINKSVISLIDGYKYNLRIDILPVKIVKDDPEEKRNDKYFSDVAGYFVYGNTKYFPSIKSVYSFNSLDEALEKKEEFLNFFINNHLNKNSELTNTSTLLLNYPYNDVNMTKERDYYKYTEIFPTKKIKFEGYEFSAPANVDAYLTKLYGAYKKIPPLTVRYPYHSKYIFLNDLTNSSATNQQIINLKNEYFYFSKKKSFKVKATLKKLRYYGIKKTYNTIIKPFIQRGFKFK
jgi:lipopolysaccharide cholinephosphotransferase